MKRNVVRLTESQLHNVIKESVKKVLNEMGGTIQLSDEQLATAKQIFGGMDLTKIKAHSTQESEEDERKANEIVEYLPNLGHSLAGMTREEFIEGVMANWGVSRRVANLVAKKTGNY